MSLGDIGDTLKTLLGHIDLGKAVEETIEEMTMEKKSEIKQKIRWVSNQVMLFEKQRKELENDVAKNADRLQKARSKLDELRKGNWDILKQINPDQKDSGQKEGPNG